MSAYVDYALSVLRRHPKSRQDKPIRWENEKCLVVEISGCRRVGARGRAIEATLARGQAARLAPHQAVLIESLRAMRRDAELAFHQAIYETNQNGRPWRLLAKFSDMSWQTLHRRYRGRPTRMRPSAEDDTWLRSRRRHERFTLPARRRRVVTRARRSPL